MRGKDCRKQIPTAAEGRVSVRAGGGRFPAHRCGEFRFSRSMSGRWPIAKPCSKRSTLPCPPASRSSRNHRHRRKRKRNRTRTGRAGRDHAGISVFDLRLFPPRQCQYVARGIARFSRADEKSHERCGPRTWWFIFPWLSAIRMRSPGDRKSSRTRLIWLKDIGVRTVSLADTVGTATPEAVGKLYSAVKDCVAGVELGVHLHSRPEGSAEKVMAAYNAGCRRFDSALTGLGGCPFAGDELVGNIATETVLRTLAENGIDTGLELHALAPVLAQAASGNSRSAKYSRADASGSAPSESGSSLAPIGTKSMKLQS